MLFMRRMLTKEKSLGYMKFGVKVWLEETGIVQFDRVSPGQCGDKYLIYSRHYPRPLVSLFFDPVTDFQEGVGGVGWEVVSGESKSNSLFIRLRELSSRFLCHGFLCMFLRMDTLFYCLFRNVRSVFGMRLDLIFLKIMNREGNISGW